MIILILIIVVNFVCEDTCMIFIIYLRSRLEITPPPTPILQTSSSRLNIMTWLQVARLAASNSKTHTSVINDVGTINQ